MSDCEHELTEQWRKDAPSERELVKRECANCHYWESSLERPQQTIADYE